MNRNLPMDTNKKRYEKPVKTPDWGAEMANPKSITLERKVKTTAAEVGWSLSDITEPSRCQETAVAAEGPEPLLLRRNGIGRLIVLKGMRPVGN